MCTTLHCFDRKESSRLLSTHLYCVQKAIIDYSSRKSIFFWQMKQPVVSFLHAALICSLFNCPTAFRPFPSTVGHKNVRLGCDSTVIDKGSTLSDEVEELVKRRANYRRERNYAAADNIKDVLTNQYSVEVIDFPFKPDGSLTWRYIEQKPMKANLLDTDCVSELDSQESLMWLARNSYNLLSSNSRSEEMIVNSAIRQLKDIKLSRIKELQGRKFADAAFEFSLAGIGSIDLYELLLSGASTEMKRYGRRNSCRPIDILQVVERLAVSGILDQDVYHLAAGMLQYKEKDAPFDRPLSYGMAVSKLLSGNFSLFSDMPLLWLWRFAARQRKHGNQAMQSKTSVENTSVSSRSNELKLPIFDDPTLPLVVDIGCGYGVSMLGLSYREKLMRNDTSREAADSFRKRNYLACDMSHRAVSYARGISKRWGMEGNCQFIEADAVKFLELIEREYEGSIECILINFPTPYKFGTNKSTIEDKNSQNDMSEDISKESLGNAQLPSDMSDFMVTNEVIELCRKIFQNKKYDNLFDFDKKNISRSNRIDDENIRNMERKQKKYFIIQTNVEDVAVVIKKLVTQSNYYNSANGFTLPVDSEEISNVRKSWEWSDSETEKTSFYDYSTDGDDDDYKSENVERVEESLEIDKKEISVTEEKSSRITNDDENNDDDKINGNNYNDDSNNNNDHNYDNNNNSNVSKDEDDTKILQKRAIRWILSGGERARGFGWLKSSPLPSYARTETEAMCEYEKKPVHRILFFYND